jgi:endoglycosylceramidase
MNEVRRRTARAPQAITAAVIVAAASLVAACAPPPLVPLPDPGDPVVAVAAPDSLPPLRMRGGDLVDGAGRVVLLRGMNSVRKDAPFISPLEAGWLGPLERQYLRRSGFNSVRLGVTFAALVPQPGQIDEDYLQRVVEVVEQLAADGIWVQLDFHQDVFHQMPDWATPPDAAGLSDEAPALFGFLGWAAAYLSERSIRQWDSFVQGEPHVGGRSVASVLGDAAAVLADRLADNGNVIGIELLNEPFAGSAVLRCIFDGCPDVERQLSDRYAEMAAPIRAAAPSMPLWLEPFAPTGYLARPTMPAPDIAPAPDGLQLGVAWHLYCHDTDKGRVEQADPLTAGFCNLRFDNGFAAGSALASALGGPRLLNEFGASQNPLDVAIATRLADEQFVSWMYWHGAPASSPTDSQIPDAVEAHLIRPYPEATAGTPGSLRYDPATGSFSFTFVADRSIDAPTSIVVPARAYPKGYLATARNGTITSSDNVGRVTVEPDGSGQPVTVVLRRVL